MQLAGRAEAATGRVLGAVARWLAYGGGIVLTGLALMVCTSIVLRKLPFTSGITGDYELVEMGCAFAIFAFLPWCQFNRGHVAVELLTDRFPTRARAVFELIADILIALVAVVILWRLYLGFGEKFPFFDQPLRDALAMGSRPFFAETSYELEIPAWMPMAAALFGAALFAVVALYTVWRGLNRLLEPRP